MLIIKEIILTLCEKNTDNGKELDLANVSGQYTTEASPDYVSDTLPTRR